MIKELENLSEATWFRTKLDLIETDPELWQGNFVSHVVPSFYPSYCKIFHNIYEDLSLTDRLFTWNDEAKLNAKQPENPLDELLSESTVIYGGDYEQDSAVRIRWNELAKRYGLTFHSEITVDSFTRNFPQRSWPRYLIGPKEGTLDWDTCREIVRSLALATSDFEISQECYFHYDLIATYDFQTDKLFTGKLIDVFKTAELEGVSSTPTHWWPTDHSWFICTDWDLAFSVLGGSDEITQSLISNNELECVKVEPSTRIDYKSDRLNP